MKRVVFEVLTEHSARQLSQEPKVLHVHWFEPDIELGVMSCVIEVGVGIEYLVVSVPEQVKGKSERRPLSEYTPGS